MRLDRYISACTENSRKKSRELIKNGSVTVNGEICADQNLQISGKDKVTLDGAPLTIRGYTYLMMNKPRGCVSAAHDKRYTTVADYAKEYGGINPVGRLDMDTEGLLLLTDDGRFQHAVTSPNKNIRKRYFARLDAPMEEKDIETFAAGMEFKDFTAKEALLEITENPYEVYVEISEGKYHQVRRMCARVGKNVLYLKRVAIGALKLDEALALGETRPLTDDELALLGYTRRERKI